MPLSGIIFDFDGTLADTVPVCCAAFREVMVAFTGRAYSDAEIIAMFGPSEEGIIRRIAGERWEECFEAYLRAYERAHANCVALFPDMPELLAVLRERGVALAVVTGKGRHSTDISLTMLGVGDYFDTIETGSPDGAVKPAAIRRVLATLQLAATDVAYVGDAASDMADAREAGIMPLAAAWAESADRVALRSADPMALFATVSEFGQWIDQHVPG